MTKNPVEPGSRFDYRIELKGAKGRVDPADLSQFPKVFGPSRSTSVKMVNGKVSRSMTISYKIKAPSEEGVYKIEASKAKANGKVLKSAPIELRVDADAKNAERKHSNNSGKASNKKLIARIELNRSRAFQGESVRVDYTLYSRYRNLRLANRKFPAVNGAWSEEIQKEIGWKNELVKIDGKPYKKAILRKVLIHPQRAGTINIDPMEVTCVVNRGFFRKGKKKNLNSNSPSLEVKELPDGAPKSFNGAVGSYQMEAGIDEDTVRANASVKLKVSLEGRGNVKLLGSPSVGIPPDLEHYDPNMEQRIDAGETHVRGNKEWEYLIVPRQSGKYEIGPVRFSYFDPDSKRYKRLKKGPFSLVVKEGKKNGSGASPEKRKNAKEKVNVIKKELRYIRTSIDDLEKKGAGISTTLKGTVLILPPALGILFLLFMRKRENRQKGLTRAQKTARKRLKDAEKALKKGERGTFHEELYKGLQSYLADRTGISHASLSKEQIRKRSEHLGIPDQLTEKTLKTLEHSEMLRYAPSQNVSDEAVHRESVELLAELERYWK